MKKPSNKASAIYLIWALFHFMLFLFAPNYANIQEKERFYPFTKKWNGDVYFDHKWYDYTEFMVYMIMPIMIYYIIMLFNTKDATDN